MTTRYSLPARSDSADTARSARTLAALVLVVFVLGVQGFILALVGEYLGRIQREVEGRPLYAIEREL